MIDQGQGVPKLGISSSDPARVSLLGHDLRAAMSDIVGGMRLIDQQGLDEPARLQLERIRAASETLARLLEEGLSIMLGDEQPIVEPANFVPIRNFLHDLQMRWSGRASEKGLIFRIDIADGLPEMLLMHRVAMERIVSNILSNALKYTDRGAVTLDVSLSDSGILRIACQDAGPGFSVEALTRLFEYKGRPETSDKPGQGLGLHIARSLIGRLGGSVQVENPASGGARVMLEFPPQVWRTEAEKPAQTLPDLAGLRILVAEDNPTNQAIIGQMLRSIGAEFVSVDDGIEAIEQLQSARFDLALIDIEMPRLNGIEVIRRLREMPDTRAATPVIAITAYVLRANRDAIYAAGADGILAKPLADLEQFGAAIANVLDRVADAPAAPVRAPDELAEFERATFDRLLDVAGPDSAGELIDRLCSDLRKCERNLIAGLAERNVQTIRSETHVLIALAGAVGANRLQALVQTLNTAAHRQDGLAMRAIAHETLTQIDRLIHFVSQEQARIRGAA